MSKAVSEATTGADARRSQTRRGLLGAAMMAGAAAATVASAAPADADAELITAHATFIASHARLWPSDGRMTTGLTDDECGAETDRWYAAMDRVTELPAHTAEGRRAKIEVAYAAMAATVYSNGDGLEREEQCALDVLASLLGSAA
nr:hypothetical protein [uncultured Rhodopila sp.]